MVFQLWSGSGARALQAVVDVGRAVVAEVARPVTYDRSCPPWTGVVTDDSRVATPPDAAPMMQSTNSCQLGGFGLVFRREERNAGVAIATVP